MNISGAEFSIFSKTFIAQANSYNSFIAKSKVFSIIIAIINSETSSDTVARLYTDCESLSMGTYSITIYCGYSLDFIIGYFKAFSNAIFNFDSYGVSIGFDGDNSKTFDDGGFNSFEDGVISYDFNIIVIEV